jgi:hypothetical protein
VTQVPVSNGPGTAPFYFDPSAAQNTDCIQGNFGTQVADISQYDPAGDPTYNLAGNPFS